MESTELKFRLGVSFGFLKQQGELGGCGEVCTTEWQYSPVAATNPASPSFTLTGMMWQASSSSYG